MMLVTFGSIGAEERIKSDNKNDALRLGSEQAKFHEGQAVS